MAPEDVVAREGRVEDYHQVVELQKSVGFLGGLDFIPCVYRYWIHSKLGQVHLAEHDGKVVSHKLYIHVFYHNITYRPTCVWAMNMYWHMYVQCILAVMVAKPHLCTH